MASGSVSFEGLTVHVYRSEHDGRLVVDIDTTELTGSDVHGRADDVPNIVIIVNDDEQRIDADGSFIPR